jgi:endonuclease-3 related protein
MPTFAESYPGIIAALADRFGGSEDPSRPHPPFARLLAAFLGRTLEPARAERVLNALRDADLLDPHDLAKADAWLIGEATSSASARLPEPAVQRLKRLARWLVEEHQGNPETLESVSTSQLREELLAVSGIGPASADAILLFALDRPVYPVDRATYRILARHGWIDPNSEYDEARDLIERQAPDNAAALARLSGWLERVGHDACRARVAKCDRCPLKPFLPEGGPREAE